MLQSHKDIKRAIESVTEINEIELDDVCTEAMECWLTSMDIQQMNADETFSLAAAKRLMKATSEIIPENEDLLKKMILILRHCKCKDSLTLKLINIALKDSVTTNKRAQALRCVFSLFTEDQVSELCHNKELWSKLAVLECVTVFESLQIPCTANVVQQCNMEDLVEMVLGSRPNVKSAIELAFSLCIDHKLFKISLWEPLLKCLMELKMMNELSMVLQILMVQPLIWDNPSYVQGWKILIYHGFNKGYGEPSKEDLVDVFINLIRCPCADRLDLEDFADQFTYHGLEALALGVRILDNKNPPIKESQNKELILKQIQQVSTNITSMYFAPIIHFLDELPVNT